MRKKDVMKRGFSRLPPGGCPGCRRGHTEIDFRPSGWICKKHGPLAEKQVVVIEETVCCLECLKKVLGKRIPPALEKRRLNREEFSGYTLYDGRFTKHHKPIIKPSLAQEERIADEFG